MKKGNRIFFIAILSILLISVFANLASSAYDPASPAVKDKVEKIEEKSKGFTNYLSEFWTVKLPAMWGQTKFTYNKDGFLPAAVYFLKEFLGELIPVFGPVIDNSGFNFLDLGVIIIALASFKVFIWIASKSSGFEKAMDKVLTPIPFSLFKHHFGAAAFYVIVIYILSTWIPVNSSAVGGIVAFVGILVRIFFGFWVLFPVFQPWPILSQVIGLIILWCVFPRLLQIPFFSKWLVWPGFSKIAYDKLDQSVMEWETERIKKLASSQAQEDVAEAIKGIEYWKKVGKNIKI